MLSDALYKSLKYLKSLHTLTWNSQHKISQTCTESTGLMKPFMYSTSHSALFFTENILSPTIGCKSRRCLSGMKMRFHYVVSHLFVLLKVWPPMGCAAAGWIKSPITPEPIEVKFGNILAWKIGLCQSDTDGPLSLALTVNHTFPIAIQALLSPSHTHTQNGLYLKAS